MLTSQLSPFKACCLRHGYVIFRLGGYVLDNFPYTREQFTLLIERSLLPDSVIHLKDSSEQGSLLAPRWIEKRRNQKHMPDMKEVDDDPQAIKIELTNNGKPVINFGILLR